ncbi:MAG: hypothetical protein H8E17_08620 [Deltaproteobacteria bacterium]|nr:hypothetical protein [Deltaproteobacteria bacterium]
MKKILSIILILFISILLAVPAGAASITAGNSDSSLLPAGKILTVSAPPSTTGSVIRLARLPGGGTVQSTTAVAGVQLIFGPYEQSERFTVSCTAGTITTATAYKDPRPKIVTILMANVDYLLSAAEALCDILLVTGSPSGLAIIAPAVAESGISRIYTVRNGGGDSDDVILKISGGTGVTVGTGKTASVYYNGSDYARQTADATN